MSAIGRLDPRIVFDALRTRWLIALIPLVLLPTLAVTARLVRGAQYKSVALLVVQDRADINPILKDLLTQMRLGARLPEVRSVARSSAMAERVLSSMGALKGLDPAAQRAQIEAFKGRIDVFGEGGGLVRLSLVGPDPKDVKAGLTALTDQIIDEMGRPEREALDQTVAFLDRQLNRMRIELTALEADLTKVRQQNANVLPEVRRLKFLTHQDLTQKLLEASADLAEAQHLATPETAGQKPTPPTKAQADAATEMSRARETLRRLKRTYTADHPDVIAAQGRLERANKVLQKVGFPQGRRAHTPEKKNAADPVAIAQRVKFLEEQLEAPTAELASFGTAEQKVVQLERAYTAKSKVYENLLARHEDARVTRALVRPRKAGHIRVIEPATRPSVSLRHNIVFLFIASLFAGLFASLSLVFLLEYLDPTTRSEGEAGRAAAIPVIARLPKLE